MKNCGRILWNAVAICEMFKTSWQMENSLRKAIRRTIFRPINSVLIADLEELEKMDASFGATVEHHSISVRDQSKLHQFGKNVLLGISFGYALFAGRNWKEYIWVADIEELEILDASDIDARRLNAKQMLKPQRCDKQIFSIADGTAKLFGRDYGLQESTLKAGSVDE